MIKVERKNTAKAKNAILSLEKEKLKKSGTYNTEEVVVALREMFSGKCYLCENKEITSYQIDHLVPHKNDRDLKFDWNNLFLSCGHCNNIKKEHYNPILDCTKVEVDKKIAFRKKGYFGIEEKLEFTPLEDSIEIKNTIELLKNIYEGNTPQKRLEAVTIRKELRKELFKFKEAIREYEDTEEGEDKIDLLIHIKLGLKVNSPFAAFKRWLLRDNKEYFKELIEQLHFE